MSETCEFFVSGPPHHHIRWFFQGNRDIAKIDIPGCGLQTGSPLTLFADHVAYGVSAPVDEFGSGTGYYGKIFYNLRLYVDEAPEYYISNGILYFYGPTRAHGNTRSTYNTIFGGTIAYRSYTEVHCVEEDDLIVYKIAVPGVPDGTIPHIEASEEAVVFGPVREPEDEGRYFQGKITLDRDVYWCEMYQCQIRNGVLRIVVPKKQ